MDKFRICKDLVQLRSIKRVQVYYLEINNGQILERFEAKTSLVLGRRVLPCGIIMDPLERSNLRTASARTDRSTPRASLATIAQRLICWIVIPWAWLVFLTGLL